VNHDREDTELDAAFTALASPHRRRVVSLLALQPASTQEVARHVGLTLPAIHRHLAVLEEARLIRRRKSGRTTFLAIDRTGLRLVQGWTAQYRPEWGTDEETLENYVAAVERRATTHTRSDER
jgi:DNA-binding transcriptional ArsR family regulator